jgi:hypothetical protein
MKKFIYLSMMSLSLGYHAQIVLTKNDFAGVNDTIRYSQPPLLSVTNYEATGEDYLWDFSGLEAETQYLKRYSAVSSSPITVQAVFGPFAPDEYKGTYYLLSRDVPIEQLNNFLPVDLSDLNTFSRATNDSITSIGYSVSISNVPTPFRSDTIETRYAFPLEYGGSHYSRGYTFIDLNPATDFKLKQYRQRTTSVDGYGTLTTPFGTHQVLRIKHVITELDSVYQTFFGGGQWFASPPILTKEYEWWANGHDDALLRIVEASNNGQPQVRLAEYKDIYLGLDANINNQSWEYNVYPSVVEHEINLSSSSIIQKIELLDMRGKLIFSENIENVGYVKDLSALENGMYLVRVFVNGQFKTTKIVKR